MQEAGTTQAMPTAWTECKIQLKDTVNVVVKAVHWVSLMSNEKRRSFCYRLQSSDSNYNTK